MLLKMSYENRKIFAGIIFIVLISLFVGFSLNIHKLKNSSKNDIYTVYAVFKRVSSLSIGADVNIAGIRVGKVAGMTLNDDYTVETKLELNTDFHLPEDSTFAIHTDGLLGKKYIEVSVGGDDENLIDNNGYASYTQDSIDLDELVEQIMSMARRKSGKKR